jgi:hypothetical protein
MSQENIQQSNLNKTRLDKFIMVFSIPPAMREANKKGERKNNSVIGDSMQFSIYGAIVPNIEVPATQIRYSGSTLYNSSHSRQPFPPVQVKFTVDNQYNNYWVIYQWLNLLHDEKTGIFDEKGLIKDLNFSDYQTDMTIFGVDEYDKNKIKFTYTKCFPTTLGSINFDYRNSAEAESSFTFVYSQLRCELL